MVYLDRLIFGGVTWVQDDILRLLATSEGDVLEDDTLVDKALTGLVVTDA